MADKSDDYVTDYAHAVIKTGRAPEALSNALLDAAWNGNVVEVNRLLTAPFINVNAHDLFRWTALILAAAQGHAEIVAALLSDSRTTADTVNAHDPWGNTALIVAADRGHAGIVAALLADPRLTSKTINAIQRGHELGKTALMLAAHRGHAAIVAMIEAHLAAHPEAAAH